MSSPTLSVITGFTVCVNVSVVSDTAQAKTLFYAHSVKQCHTEHTAFGAWGCHL